MRSATKGSTPAPPSKYLPRKCQDGTITSPRDEKGENLMFKPGDRIVYRQSKHSTHPSLRAVEVRPAPKGEYYSYDVLKYWVVSRVQPDGRLQVVTRRGKQRTVHVEDPALRRARWWERLFFASRFPSLPKSENPKPGKKGQLSYE